MKIIRLTVFCKTKQNKIENWQATRGSGTNFNYSNSKLTLVLLQHEKWFEFRNNFFGIQNSS